IRDRFESVKRSVDISSTGLMQRVLERFLSSGRFDSHLWAVRRRYQSAFAAFDAGLSEIRGSGLRWSNPGGGINAWIKVPARVSAKAFADRCLASGCAVAPETSFRYDRSVVDSDDSHVRVSFGSVQPSALSAAAIILGKTASLP
ncbi:MAG: hypothetical protein JXM71_10435, partial [Spirochaetales bacterium]|nr:hypothetical protein [Spirochaetales bacterium]